MKNKLWYLGFLSLVSLLYFVEYKTAFIWFLGFVAYFSLFKVSDERLEKNVGGATRNAFLFTIFFGVATLAYIYLTENMTLFGPAFAIMIGGNLLICLLSLFYYDKTNK